METLVNNEQTANKNILPNKEKTNEYLNSANEIAFDYFCAYDDNETINADNVFNASIGVAAKIKQFAKQEYETGNITEAESLSYELIGSAVSMIALQYLKDHNKNPEPIKVTKANFVQMNHTAIAYAEENPEASFSETKKKIKETVDPWLIDTDFMPGEDADEYIDAWLEGARGEIAFKEYSEAAGFKIAKASVSEDLKGTDFRVVNPNHQDEILEVDVKSSTKNAGRAQKNRTFHRNGNHITMFAPVDRSSDSFHIPDEIKNSEAAKDYFLDVLRPV